MLCSNSNGSFLDSSVQDRVHRKNDERYDTKEKETTYGGHGFLLKCRQSVFIEGTFSLFTRQVIQHKKKCIIIICLGKYMRYIFDSKCFLCHDRTSSD